MLTIRTGLVALVLTAPAAVVLPVLPAAAATPACGSVIKTSVTFTRDLTCAGTALRIDNTATNAKIRIDLHGHTLRGTGASGAAAIESESIIRIGTAVTVTGGTIAGFDRAFAVGVTPVPEDPALVIDRMMLRADRSWLYFQPYRVFHSVTVTDSTVIDSGTGGVDNSAWLVVRDSTFIRSGIRNGAEPNLTVTGNTFIGGGVVAGDNAYVLADHNTFTGCDTGIVTSNPMGRPPSIFRDNLFAGCRIGMTVADTYGDTAVTGNAFVGNQQDGLSLGFTFPGALRISGNRFLDNGGNGLAGMAGPGVVIASNTATGNGGHGIAVGPMVRNGQPVSGPPTDGGGNRASGNRMPPQCVGVTCTPA